MFEVACASCQVPFEFNQDDYIHLCPFCSSGFVIDPDEGIKDLIGDHYIIPSNLQNDQVEEIFFNWITERYHRRDRIKQEFKILGYYGIMLPYWVVSLEAHTFWSGHCLKEKSYPGQSRELGAKFIREEGRFSRRYRWSILARKSPKEHWGLERLHHPKEHVFVDWDGFPLDETMGKPDAGDKPIYEAKMPFKFEHTGNLSVMGIQIKESLAIMRTKDQINEYHRRMAKTKIGTLYEYKTEVEIVGIHLLHVPFWFVRYAYTPKSVFKYLSTARELHLVLQGYTKAVVEAELPLNTTDKVMANLIVCGVIGLISLSFSIFVHPLFFIIFIIFLFTSIYSLRKILKKENSDPDLIKGYENKEPAL